MASSSSARILLTPGVTVNTRCYNLAPMATPLQERKRDLVRDAIADAAWRLFAAEGYEAATVADIARAAGVSRRTFFRYFSSKEDVVVGTSDALAEDLLAAFARRPPGEPPLEAIRETLRPLVASRLADARQARAIVRLLRESRTLRRAMLERHARMEERLADLLARRTRAGRRSDPTPALLAFVTRALLDTAFNVWYDQRPRDVEAMVDGLFERLRTVVGAGPRAARRTRHAGRRPRAARRRRAEGA
jgi:AcrR family transcriptional regulator